MAGGTGLNTLSQVVAVKIGMGVGGVHTSHSKRIEADVPWEQHRFSDGTSAGAVPTRPDQSHGTRGTTAGELTKTSGIIRR
jgi:hypothetical protein